MSWGPTGGHQTKVGIPGVALECTCAWQGTSKSGLMGFCDCAPGEAKELRVLFLVNKEPHMATLSDQVRLYALFVLRATRLTLTSIRSQSPAIFGAH